MVMLCWFYCIPFAQLVYYLSGLLVFIFALFMLKRGIRQARAGLRRIAFLMMFIGAVKLSLFDMHNNARNILCDLATKSACTLENIKRMEAAGILLLLASGIVIFLLYKRYSYVEHASPSTPEAERLRFWANTSLGCVIAMTLWQLAPWAGYLTVGSIPQIFNALPWQSLAILNAGLLLIGFWKVESCVWIPPANGQRMNGSRHINSIWTPKDTLWMSLSIFVITLALSYVAHDVLA